MAEQHEKALVPQIRFTSFTDPWEQRKLGEVARRVTRKNENGDSDLPLTISAQYGLVDQRTFFNSQVASKDMNGYFLLHRGEFAYNKSTSTDSPWGAIKRLEKYDMGCVSTLYICFELLSGDPDFLVTYYETDRWYKSVQLIAAEGARNHGLLNIAPDDFFETQICIPKRIDEQRRIGAFFDRLDSLITLHQRKYDKLCVLKKSMLDKMFPKGGSLYPEIRFAGFTDPWEQRKLGELTESYSGGTPAAGESEFYGGSIPFIRSAEIAAESTELFLTEKGYESSSARMVKPGDVLYALYGATSGEVAVSRQKGAINQAILAILPRDDCDARYITAWLRKQKGYIVTTYLQGGQGNLSGMIVKNLEVSIPSLPEQQKIGSMLSHLDSLITLHQRKLELLRNIKKSMLDKMFV
uniref:restriction endonuclease subunit S n=1 Tax=Bifidobacterium adolescentis TaxID=1680 RepID=UPI00359CA9A0